MQLYRVKLQEGHTARPDQVAGEYLGNYSNIDPALYTRGEAYKKAKLFGGTIEPFGKNYLTDEVKVLQLSKKQIGEDILADLKDRESFVDTDNDLNEVMYSADIFETILCELDELQEKLRLIKPSKSTQIVLDELLVLNELSKNYQYIMLTSF
jgi:hypothetical protein